MKIQQLAKAKIKKLFLVFFPDHKDAQFLSVTEMEIKRFCEDFRELKPNYVRLNLNMN